MSWFRDLLGAIAVEHANAASSGTLPAIGGVAKKYAIPHADADGNAVVWKSSGAAGQVLALDANGEPQWSDPGSVDLNHPDDPGDDGKLAKAASGNLSWFGGSSEQILKWSGGAAVFGALNLAAAAAITGKLPFANLADGSAEDDVLKWNGSAWISDPNLGIRLLGGAPSDHTSGGTWNKPADSVVHLARVAAGGGGGGGGEGQAAGNTRVGGGGGGGGAIVYKWFLDAELGSSETVTVGAGGASGPGGSSGNGTAGGAGGNSSLGTALVAYGGGGGGEGGGTGTTGGGGGGALSAGQTATSGTNQYVRGGQPAFTAEDDAIFTGLSQAPGSSLGGGGSVTEDGCAGGASVFGGGGGGNSQGSVTGASAGGGSVDGGSGGGGGGGITSANATLPAAAGGIRTAAFGSGGAAGTSGATATAGAAGSAGGIYTPGAGGGGGGSDTNSTGGAGGDGGAPSGGGGGGGGGTSTGGAGGVGGAGRVTVWSFG